MYPSQLEFIKHIEDECVFLLKVTLGKAQQQILDDEILCKAIVRSLEIIGEASKKVDEQLKTKYPQIDWKSMAGMRDKLIHDYFGIDYDIVLDAIANDIPDLRRFKLADINYAATIEEFSKLITENSEMIDQFNPDKSKANIILQERDPAKVSKKWISFLNSLAERWFPEASVKVYSMPFP